MVTWKRDTQYLKEHSPFIRFFRMWIYVSSSF